MCLWSKCHPVLTLLRRLLYQRMTLGSKGRYLQNNATFTICMYLSTLLAAAVQLGHSWVVPGSNVGVLCSVYR